MTISYQNVNWTPMIFPMRRMFPGADPGFCVRGDESRRGVWGPLNVSSGSRAEPGGGGVIDPRELLGFEYLESFSVNNIEAFCECDEVY